MKAASKILTVGSKGREKGSLDWDQCLICQDSTKTSKSEPLRKTTIVGVQTVAECCKERKKSMSIHFKGFENMLFQNMSNKSNGTDHVTVILLIQKL